MKCLEVGKIVTTHGIKGEVKVSITTDNLNRFNVGNKLLIKLDKEYKEITISSFRMHKNMALISFDNITNINDVLQYVGLFLYVDRDMLDDLEKGEYYYDDLIGLDVYDKSLESGKIGTVVDVIEVPQGEILRIKLTNGKKALVPYVDEYIKEIDVDNNIMIISSVEGLLWK